MTKTLELTKALIAKKSITPDDKGCQTILAKRLRAAGFQLTPLRFGKVRNFWAQRGGGKPLLVFAGHTDVVPPGDLSAWRHPPFSPLVKNGVLYGRGAADMKGALAAMVVAAERFCKNYPNHQGALGFLITADEEGAAEDGTVRVVSYLREQNIRPDYCLIGEPSSEKMLGDVIKNGRRGSLTGMVEIFGEQGHIAYPHLAKNPIHSALSALSALIEKKWDTAKSAEKNASKYFDPTSFQIFQIQAGAGATNIIPGNLNVAFNFRYSPATSAQKLMNSVAEILDKNALKYRLDWHHSGEPFFSAKGILSTALADSIMEIKKITPKFSTGGGTSDGRFIAKYCDEVIEFGVINSTIHKANECVRVDDLENLQEIYYRTLEKILC